MACNKPIGACFIPNLRKKYGDMSYKMSVPCGQCMGCRLAKTHAWATRMTNESSLHSENCFVTLTYDEKHYPEHGTLIKKDLQNFFRRLRRLIKPKKIRFFACGEYGEKLQRPHYHAIIFNYWPPDLKFLKESKTGYGNLFTSKQVQDAWQDKGMNAIADCTFESSAYCASYVTKKITGKSAEYWYTGRIPEFALMSRKPGIGGDFYEKYKTQIWKTQSILARGHLVNPPKFYGDRQKSENEVKYLLQHWLRLNKYLTENEMEVNEQFLIAKQKTFKKNTI